MTGCGRKIGPYDCCTVVCGDCLELMKVLPDGCVDAVITDPPYCSGAHESARRGKREARTPESVNSRPTIQLDDMGLLGYQWVTRQWFLDARRFMLEGGSLACFSDWRMTPFIQLMLETAGWRLTNVIVWDKTYPGLGSGFRAQHEFIVLASNGQPNWFSYDYGNVIQSVRLTDTEHPHQKPVDIVEKIIQTCSPEAGTVADLFLGVGTTAVAAKKLGRHFLGFEISPEYCKIAEDRIALVEAQPNLFDKKRPETGRLELSQTP